MKTFNQVKIYSLTIEDLQVVITKDSTFKTLSSNQVSPQIEKLKTIHFHLDYEIFFINKGDLVVHLTDDVKTFNNSIVLLPPHLLHYSEASDNNYRLQIKIEKKHNSKNSLLFDKISQLFDKTQINTADLTPSIIFLLEELNRGFENNYVAVEEREKSILTLLFLEMLNSYGLKQQTSSSVSPSNYLLTIDNIINNELDEKIDLQFVADKLHLSTKQTARIIKKHFNCSLSELILQKKLSIACMLLTNTDLKISEIINIINIETNNYFFRIFKKTFGMSPLQYRKTHQLSPENNND